MTVDELFDSARKQWELIDRTEMHRAIVVLGKGLAAGYAYPFLVGDTGSYGDRALDEMYRIGRKVGEEQYHRYHAKMTEIMPRED